MGNPKIKQLAKNALEDEIAIYKEQKAKNDPNAAKDTIAEIEGMTWTKELSAAASEIVKYIVIDDARDKELLVAALNKLATRTAGRRTRRRRRRA